MFCVGFISLITMQRITIIIDDFRSTIFLFFIVPIVSILFYLKFPLAFSIALFIAAITATTFSPYFGWFRNWGNSGEIALAFLFLGVMLFLNYFRVSRTAEKEIK